MLAARGIVSEADRDALLAGLDAVERELREETFPFAPGRRRHPHGDRAAPDRDRRARSAGRLHTARSRNDQVVTDLAMYTRERCRARAGGDRRADGGAAGARRGARRLADARLHPPAARPAGVPRPPSAGVLLDARARPRSASPSPQREAGAPAARRGRAGGRELRHRPAHGRATSSASPRSPPNSIDAVSGRDFVLDYLNAAATCATHLSRLGAELVLWSSAEFGFCELPDAWSSGSLDHAAEEEPRRGRAAAREGAARGRPPRRRCTA